MRQSLASGNNEKPSVLLRNESHLTKDITVSKKIKFKIKHDISVNDKAIP